jgi:hypothetical protein
MEIEYGASMCEIDTPEVCGLHRSCQDRKSSIEGSVAVAGFKIASEGHVTIK